MAAASVFARTCPNLVVLTSLLHLPADSPTVIGSTRSRNKCLLAHVAAISVYQRMQQLLSLTTVCVLLSLTTVCVLLECTTIK
jgi:hypothetical protein